MSAINWSLQIAYATKAQWTSWNGILKAGQEGAESDTGQRKIGDAATHWNDLPYLFVNNITITDGITAHAGGGQGSATALIASQNFIDTVGTNGDSVKVLAALKNRAQLIVNDGLNDLSVYPQSGENFSGQAANAALTVSPGGLLNISCAVIGTWRYY